MLRNSLDTNPDSRSSGSGLRFWLDPDLVSIEYGSENLHPIHFFKIGNWSNLSLKLKVIEVADTGTTVIALIRIRAQQFAT